MEAYEDYEGDLDVFYCELDEDDYIKKIEKHLEEGGDIDVRLNRANMSRMVMGTILHHSIWFGYPKIVKFALEKGAKLNLEAVRSGLATIRRNSDLFKWNALELAILRWELTPIFTEIFEIVKAKSLELYSTFGLHPIHLYSVAGRFIPDEYLTPSLINKTISVHSPLWPGLTPLYLAAKFYRPNLVQILLDNGASGKVRDSSGNTPLHFMSVEGHYDSRDSRLFIHDEEDTYGDWTGEAHFHIACKSSKRNVVKQYLKEGLSPNLPTRKSNGSWYPSTKGNTGLHITHSAEVTQLLIEFGADINIKNGKGATALDTSLYYMDGISRESVMKRKAYRVCLLIEAGAKSDDFEKSMELFVGKIREYSSCRLIYLCCIERMTVANKELLCQTLLDYYQQLLKETPEFEGMNYAENCRKEMKELAKFGLRPDIRGNFIGPDFKIKLLRFNNTDWSVKYPIYGHLMMIILRRGYFEFKKKRERLPKALPCVIQLVRKFCSLPVICADLILWNLNAEELDLFLKAFSDKEA